MGKQQTHKGFEVMREYRLWDALLGRRSRRFAKGMEIPTGVFQYKSQHPPEPLSEFETLLVVCAMGGVTGWNYLIPFNKYYQPKLPNYAGAAGGRTFPSAAGFHSANVFFTDDSGIYFLDTKNAPALLKQGEDGLTDPQSFVEANRGLIRKLQDSRIQIPAEVPYYEGHNTWVLNKPGTLLVFPVADLAEHFILGLMYFLQNNQIIFDDIHNEPIPGLEKFAHLADLDEPLPISFADMLTLGEATVELGCSCFAGALALQSMGLGGWTLDGLNPYAVLGVLDDPSCPGLGFSFDMKEGWSLPNPTGLPGVFEGHCPPFYPDMAAAVEHVYQRKFGSGGPFNGETPGDWKDSHEIRSAAEVHSEEFRECVTLQAQYIYDRFGKFPATIPSIWTIQYVQAQHIDLDFYDKYYRPGACLDTHRHHDTNWHD